MKEKIDKEFSSKVDFSQEKDLFHGYILLLFGYCNIPFHNISIISSGLQLLVTNLESGCDTALVSMTKVTTATSIVYRHHVMIAQVAWQHIEVVGDQSNYVDTIAGRIRTIVPLIRENLISARKYFTNFCHKFAK